MENTKPTQNKSSSDLRFEEILLNAMDAAIILGDLQNIVFFNKAAEAMFETRAEDMVGQPLDRLIPELSRHGRHEQAKLFPDGDATTRRSGALGVIRGRRANGEVFRIEAAISQITYEDKWLAMLILRDVSERFANEEARKLLSEEVDHRAKNALTVVHAIIKLTSADTIDGYIKAMTGRLDALARAYGTLAKCSWAGGNLREVIDEELGGLQATGQVNYEGSNVTLVAKAVQPLSLLFHELATNAVKYGALSMSGGKVSIHWGVIQGGCLKIQWSESGGPPVLKPTRSGFGSQLIKTLGGQLQGQTVSDWSADGLLFSIELPAQIFMAQNPPQIDAESQSSPDQPSSEKRGGSVRRVLVVEDEAIVALVLTSGLKSLGWEPLGPAATIDQAYNLLKTESAPDVALLDLNLGDMAAYPLASLLRTMNIPFAFYTGYSAPVVQDDFKNIELISKPSSIDIIDSMLLKVLTSHISKK